MSVISDRENLEWFASTEQTRVKQNKAYISDSYSDDIR